MRDVGSFTDWGLGLSFGLRRLSRRGGLPGVLARIRRILMREIGSIGRLARRLDLGRLARRPAGVLGRAIGSRAWSVHALLIELGRLLRPWLLSRSLGAALGLLLPLRAWGPLLIL
jgi:hypothetical protein